MEKNRKKPGDFTEADFEDMMSSEEAIRFLQKHSELTAQAARMAVTKLRDNGFRIVRPKGHE